MKERSKAFQTKKKKAKRIQQLQISSDSTATIQRTLRRKDCCYSCFTSRGKLFLSPIWGFTVRSGRGGPEPRQPGSETPALVRTVSQILWGRLAAWAEAHVLAQPAGGKNPSRHFIFAFFYWFQLVVTGFAPQGTFGSDSKSSSQVN